MWGKGIALYDSVVAKRQKGRQEATVARSGHRPQVESIVLSSPHRPLRGVSRVETTRFPTCLGQEEAALFGAAAKRGHHNQNLDGTVDSKARAAAKEDFPPFEVSLRDAKMTFMPTFKK